MAFSNGTFSRLFSWASDQSNGIKIRADRMDAEFDGMATGLSTTLLKDGSQTATQRIPFAQGVKMGGQSIQLDPANTSAITASSNNVIIVSANGANQIKIIDGAIAPVTDNDVDLGTSSLEFKDAFFDGTVTTDGLTIGSSTSVTSVDANMAGGVSGSDDTLASAKTIKAYVDSQVGAADTLAEVLGNGNTTTTDQKIQFRDSGIFINSSADGQLDVVADTEIQIAASTIDIDGAVVLNGAVTGATNVTLSGELDAGSLDVSGDADIDGTTNLDAVDIDGNVQLDGTLTVGVDDTGYDVKLFGATASAHLLWDASADKLLTVGGALIDIVKDKLMIGGTAVTTTAAELNILDGVTASTAELNILDGVTSTASEINLLDAVARGKIIYGNASGASALLAPGGANTVLTSDGTDISWAAAGAASSVAADNITAGDAAVLLTTSSGNITIDAAASDSDIILKGTDGGADTTFLTIDGSAAGAATFNNTVTMTGLVLGSTAVTSTAAELNILDGATVVVGEINALDLGATAVGTAIASKAVVLDSNKDYTGLRNVTLSGELDAGSLDVSGNADIDGTLETDALSINGTTVTSTAAELNILDGVTSTAAELNILDGVTSTTAELNILDGVTSTAAELNILDGVTSTAAELNLVDAIARGKILYGNSSGASALLSPGSNEQVLTSDGTDISWADAGGGGATAINGLSDAFTSGTNALYLGTDVGNSSTSTNTGVGQGSLPALSSSGGLVTALGYRSGQKITSGGSNTCIGGKSGDEITTGTNNTTIGPNAAKSLTTGTNNIVIGSSEAGENLTTGTHNTILGSTCGKATDSNIGCTIVGFSANPSSNSVAHEVTLGGSSVGALRCQVTSITALSDRRDKKDIVPLELGLDFINTLNAVKFTWAMRDGGKVGQQEAGFIAQELDEAQIAAGAEDFLDIVLKENPDKLEAAPGKLIPVLVRAIQELSDEVATLKEKTNGS